MVRHTTKFLRRYKRSLGWAGNVLALGNVATLCLPKYRHRARTFVSTTELLDPQYKPAFRVASEFESYFRPVQLTDSNGELNPELEEVMRFRRHRQRADENNQLVVPLIALAADQRVIEAQ